MLNEILASRAAWEREHQRTAIAVHASAAVIDYVRREALVMTAGTLAPALLPPLLGVKDGCDWYLDPALAGESFRFE